MIKAKPRINPENMGKVDFNRSDLKYIINNTRENISDIPKIKIRFIAFDVRYINARYIKIFFLSNLSLLSRTAKYATSALRAINKYFNFSPKINYNERWYFSQIEKNWNIENQEIDTDTLFRFTRASEINLNAGLNTKIYGTANFSKGYIRGFRHVITPNVSFNYRPNISKNLFREVQSSSTGNK